MCINSFIDFAPDAPIEFKKSYLVTHHAYKVSSQISSYSLKIGYLLGSAISGLQQSLSKLYFNQELDQALSTAIPIVMVIVGFVYGITFMIASSQKKIIDRLLEKYSLYFKIIPDNDGEGMVDPSAQTVAALKFIHH